MNEERSASSRAFVLGLDGVPWPLLHDFIEGGALPNLTRLVEEGAAGSLASTTPATTPLAWPSIATGTRPDKHGIYGFRKLTSSYAPKMYTSRDIQQPAVWDILSPAMVGNVPMTYPAPHIDGKVLSGMITPEINDQFAHPSDLRDALLERVPEYRIGLDWSEYGGKEDELFSDITDLVEKRRQAMQLLMETEEWRLFFFVFTAPDRLQHLIWDEEILLDHYRQLDDIVGEIIEYVQQFDATLYVVSDHGFGPISKFVAVNRVLEDNGMLTRQDESGVQSAFSKLGISRDRATAMLSKAGISGQFLVNNVPEPILRLVGQQFPGDDVMFDVNYPETEIFVHDHGCLYVNDSDRFVEGCVAPGEREAVKAKVKTTISDLTDPETGRKALKIYDGNDLFPTDPRSPDLVLEAEPGYEPIKSMKTEIFSGTGEKAASHRPDGIVIAWGPNVQQEANPRGASVYDIAPTLLHDLGEPVPANTDGRVLAEIFEPGSEPAEQSVRSMDYDNRGSDGVTEEDFEGIKDRLSGLGYLE